MRRVETASAGLLLLLAGLILSGCTGGIRAVANPDLPQPAPSPSPVAMTLEEAEGVAGAFLEAWVRRDYAAMYQLVSFNSREAYPQETFTAAYESAAREMTLDTVEYTMRASLRQGNTVLINYDVTFHTGLMGDFFDTGRTLNLVATAEGWRVAWSSTDIFSELADGATLRLERVLPTRANIYDRDGVVLANQSGVLITVSLVQENIPDRAACDASLMRALNLTADELQGIYNRYAPTWRADMGEISPATYEAMQQELVANCAAEFGQRATRRYPSGLAPHVVGYVGFPTPELIPGLAVRGITEDTLVGVSGVELSWDETLTGHPGGRLQIISATGQVIRTLAEVAPVRSESVYLTIDADLQGIVQQALADAYTVGNWAPYSRGAAVVVMDVHTGAILAMASYPTFDPNILNPDNRDPGVAALRDALLTDPANPQLNRVTQGGYPAGSVFKIVTMIAAADSGVYPLDHRYTCIGYWAGDIIRSDWKTDGHGTLTLPQALTQSCDPYFYQTGADLDAADPNLLPNYARRLGFGVPTGIVGLPEFAGLVPDPVWKRETFGLVWTFSDAVNMSIGQGELLVTPLQIARLVAAVANGGDLLVPQVVDRTQIIGEEPSYVMQPRVERSLGVRRDVLQAVYDAMCQVTVNPAGTAQYVFADSTVSVCGKTGTAQTGGADTPPHAWFAAFSPAQDPQIAIVAIVETSHEGSAVAAPIIRRILEQYTGAPVTPWPTWWQGEYVPLSGAGA